MWRGLHCWDLRVGEVGDSIVVRCSVSVALRPPRMLDRLTNTLYRLTRGRARCLSSRLANVIDGKLSWSATVV